MVSNGAVVVDSSIDDPALYAFVEVASGFDSNECKKRGWLVFFQTIWCPESYLPCQLFLTLRTASSIALFY